MTGHFWLDWAVLGVSLFNTLLLLWLGLTVALNAERRGWGIGLSSGGLLLGAVFFISHTAILGHGVSVITPGPNFWWRLGWIPVAALPFLWYLVMLWYAGYWGRADKNIVAKGMLYRRQRGWFALTVAFGLVLLGLLAFANPLPTLDDLALNQPASTPSIGGIPALILAYPLHTLLCMALSIDALRHSEASERLMADTARRRANRWLIATSVVLLFVSLLVGWVMLWIVNNAWRGIFQLDAIVTVGWFDLAIASLIALSLLLLGQAVVSYEVFTGKTLPRRGLSQYWRRAVGLSAGFSLLAAWSLTIGLEPIYTLLLSAAIMIAFFALLGWRAYAERERLIENLRPFASGQNYVGSLLEEEHAAMDPQHDALYAPFHALCANVLEASRAGLFPYGSLALLAEDPYFYPQEEAFNPQDLDTIAARLREEGEIGVALAPGESGGMVLAVPLWRDEGLSGTILLGHKLSGSPYTQEEIEIAQATGERLLDARAGAEITRRLIALQRKRMVAGQVADQRVRRKLHDETIPLLHTAMINIAGEGFNQGEINNALDLLKEVHDQLSDLLRTMPAAMSPEVRQEGLLGALRKTAGEEMAGAFDKVEWHVEPGAELLADALPPLIAEVVYAALREGIRNAARHGRGKEDQSLLRLQIGIGIEDSRLLFTLEDNGVGFEATHGDGRAQGASGPGSTGQGLALHSTLMAVIGGSMSVSSQPGQYTRITLEVPKQPSH